MSSEKELTQWLGRLEVSFEENLNFAIKIWKSSEFTLCTKYEIVLNWITDNIKEFKRIENDPSWKLFEEFCQLRCPSPGLIGISTKRKFVGAIIKLAQKCKSNESRKLVEILHHISLNENFQDYFKTEYEGYCRLLGRIFLSYEKYLELQNCLLVAHESAFFSEIMRGVKDDIKKTGNADKFEGLFTTHTLQPLIQVIISLKTRNLYYFDDLLDISKRLYEDYEKSIFSERFAEFPTHVTLMITECGIATFRGDVKFFQQLISKYFSYSKKDIIEDLRLNLRLSAYVLGLLKKHDVALNFAMPDSRQVLAYLGGSIERSVQQYHKSHPYEILLLLCSTLRLNPLILEKEIFNITALILTEKRNELKHQKKFEEFLVLLMEMFRKMSRAEKFVGNLLKSLKTHLLHHKMSGKRKSSDNEEQIIKKKLKGEEGNVLENDDNDDRVSHLEILFNCLEESSLQIEENKKGDMFKDIAFAWPAKTVGYAFSKLISSLMSKPSLVTWKSLIFSLKEHLETLKKPNPKENTLFLLDYNCAMLCQFLAGCKLHDQSDKFWNEIETTRNLTRSTLSEFGQILLSLEHNNRTMVAFLEYAYYVGFFDLILWYYRPDFMQSEEKFSSLAQNIHDFLTPDEWVLIEQRIINFGQLDCKISLNRLCLQRLSARLLFLQENSFNVPKGILSSTFSDSEHIKAIFSDANYSWILNYLTNKEKVQICDLIVFERNLDMVANLSADGDFFELIVTSLYKRLAECFKESKKSILGSIDFVELQTMDIKTRTKVIVQLINSKKGEYNVKNIDIEEVKSLIEFLTKLPIAFCRQETKMFITALHLAQYRDLFATKHNELAAAAFASFIDILHFGPTVPIFNYFNIDDLLQFLSPSEAPDFYSYIFNILRLDIAGAELFLAKIVQTLKNQSGQLSDDNVTLIVISIEVLSVQTTHKKLKRFLEEIYKIYADHIGTHFSEGKEVNSKKDKKFVEKTLPAYSTYVNWLLAKSNKAELDKNVRRICKIYIGHSMDCHNSNALKLMIVALNNRADLHFDPDEIEFVLQSYWTQLLEALKSGAVDEKIAESVIKLVINNKTNEDFLKTMKQIKKDLKISKDSFEHTCRILALISKCHLSTIKGAIFNEQFKLIAFDIITYLREDPSNQILENATVLSLIECQRSICENSKISISIDTLDDMLSFLIDINIKRFATDDTNSALFNKLMQAMIELCSAILKYRHVLLLDRVPQISHVFRDLLQAICWFKSDRQKDTSLSDDDLGMLDELAMKMESLMHLIASHSLEVKRVAPYLLTFTISLMVSNKRPTTLYPKIKTHIENICYDLVSVCDHRVGRFILRCSNDASRQVYEELCKEYNKYHKFKGKV